MRSNEGESIWGTTMRLTAVFAALYLTGCATALSEKELEEADYGPLPENYEDLAWEWLDENLRDSESARVRFLCEPFRAYARDAPIKGGAPTHYGWLLVTEVNAKNGFGAYTGWKEMRLMVSGGEVAGRLEPNMYFSEWWYQEPPLECP